jgi:hypothetical protein
MCEAAAPWWSLLHPGAHHAIRLQGLLFALPPVIDRHGLGDGFL